MAYSYSMLRLPVVALLIVLSLPALAGFGPEYPVTAGDIVAVSTPGARNQPRIASNGDGYLVVWSDTNAGLPTILGTRVAADGTPLDRTPILIKSGGTHADVTWTGQSYLVVWSELFAIYGRSVSVDGVVGQTHLALEAPQNYGISGLALASNGSNALVVTGNLGIGSLLEPTGERIGQFAMTAANGSSDHSVGIASAGDEYLVAISAPSGVFTQRVSASGQAGPALAVPGIARGSALAIATDGSRYLLAGTSRDGAAQLISRDNQLIGAAQTLFTDPFYPAFNPSLAWRDGEYVLTFSRKNEAELHVLRIDGSGAPEGVPVLFATTTAFGNADLIARGGGQAAAVWIDHESSVRVGLIDNASVTTSTPVRPARSIAGGTAPQRLPSVVQVNHRLIAGWLEILGSTIELRIAPLGGKPLTVAQVQLAWGAEVRLAFHGDTLWVFWFEGLDLKLRRYTAALVPIDPEPWAFRIDEESVTDLAFAAGAGRFSALVAFPSFTGIDTFAFHEVGAGLVLIRGHISAPDYPSHHPAVAWDGDQFVVAFAHDLGWTWWQFPQPYDNNVLASRVSFDGIVLDSTPIEISRANATNIDAVRAVRGSDGAIAIAWQDSKNNVFTARFTGSEPLLNHSLGGGTTELGPLVPTAGGYVLFRHEGNGAIHSQRLAANASANGEKELVVSVDLPFHGERFYDVAVLNQRPHIVYTRRAFEPEYGGVPRLFWRADNGVTTIRRRAVR